MSILDRFFKQKDVEVQKAVYSGDLESYLDSLGILEEIRSSEYYCEICGDEITLDNIGAIFVKEDKIAMSCDKSDCVEQAG